MTLSKDQRRHRKRQKESKRDTKRAVSSGGLSTRHITKQNITVRVSEDAFQKLAALAEKEGRTKAEQLDHILNVRIPKYSYHMSGDHPAIHKWRDEDMNQEGMSFRYRAEKASKKISYWISSTAVKKLHAHKTHTKYSKARIVETAIMVYEPLPDQIRAKAREKYHEMMEMYATPRQQSARYYRPDSQITVEHLVNRLIQRGENMSAEEFDRMCEETYAALQEPYERYMDEQEERMKRLLESWKRIEEEQE